MADHSSSSRSSVKGNKAWAGEIGDCMAHNPHRGDGEGLGTACAVPYPSCVLGLAMVEWQL
jgi:hypothetical protein